MAYAVGEIILVVLGILIAVSINNWNENRKQQKELKNIYSTIREDLRNDIGEITKVLNYYKQIEPYFKTIINDSLTREKYMENPSYAFIILGFPEISFDQRGFKLLSDYRNSSDSYQDTLIATIVDFYTERMKEIEVDDELRSRDFNENFDHWKSNYDWWAKYIHDKDYRAFTDYAFTSDYKNRVATAHFITYDVFLPEIRLFRETGIKLIEAIDLQLNGPRPALSELEKHANHFKWYKDSYSLNQVVEQLPEGADTTLVKKLLGEPIDMGFDYRYLLDSVSPTGCIVGAVFHIDDKGKIDQKWLGDICE